MKKRIAIIGAGISGLIFANLLKQNSKYDFIIYEKNSSINLKEGYGVQLSVNSISILNKIGFKNLKIENKFNPKKIDFYSLKKNNKICDLDLVQFNSQDIHYTTLKRSFLIKFLKEKLYTNSIQFNQKVKKIDHIESKVKITLESNYTETFDYMIIADGIFSLTKSILFNKNILPKYFGSIAIRALVKKEDFKFINENNISLFLGSNTHLVAYAVSIKNEINLVAIIRKNLDKNNLSEENFFNDKDNIKKFITESSIQTNDDFKNIFNKAQDLKCFPTFISDKIRQPGQKNIFLIGDALYTSPPTFAQGASQSVESAYELFNTLNADNKDGFNKYYDKRTKKLKMINRRSKLNYFFFHLSNPVLISIRNIILKIIVTNKQFLDKYLGQIYQKE